MPREDRARAAVRRAPWRARSCAGAAQYPCAEHRGGVPRVAPRSTPSDPGPVAQDSPAWPLGRRLMPWVDGLTPIRPWRTGTSPPGPARAALPRTSARGTGGGRARPLLGLPPSSKYPRTSPRGPRGPGGDTCTATQPARDPRGREGRGQRPPSRPGRRDRRGHVTSATSRPP